jgi:hypothetical protein
MVSCVLVIKRLPEALPMAEGANLAMNVVLCPAVNVNGSGGPVTVKPPPDATALVIVEGAVLEFLNVRL